MDCQEYRVGRFVLQPFRQLLDGRIPVSIRRKALALLSVLAKAEGALVTKDELMAAVWHNGVVEDNALQVQIASLRKLLHADAGLLTTVHGFGYRLAAGPVAARPERQARLQPVMDSGPPASVPGGEISASGRKRTTQTPTPVLAVRSIQPGQGGNPNSGRSKTYREVVRLAQKCSARAILRLAELTQSGDERIALLASQALLDRAYRKSRAFMDLSPAEAPVASERLQKLMAVLAADLDARSAAKAIGKTIRKHSEASGRTCGAPRDMPDIRRYPL